MIFHIASEHEAKSVKEPTIFSPKLMAGMARATNEELNIIIQHISSPSATNQEKSNSNAQEKEYQYDFANFFNHIHAQTKSVDQEKI